MRSILPLFVVSVAAVAPAIAAEVVPVPQFHSIELRGGGKVVVRPGPVQRVTLLSGSSRVTDIEVRRNGELRIDACTGRCPPRYRLEVLVETPQARALAVSGGGSIVAQRGFRAQSRLTAAVSGGGSVDVRAIPADAVSAAVNGGGDIRVLPRASLSGAINGGGLIRYWGNPRVSSAVNGGGAIRRGD